MNSEVSLIAVARIVKPFGLRGEVKLHLLADLKDFLSYRIFYIKEKFFVKTLTISNIRSEGKIALFEGHASRDDAELLRGKTLYIREEDLLAKNRIDEFYPFDLEGLSVTDTYLGELGYVRSVQELAGRWYLDITGKKDILVPFIKPLVREVQWSLGKIIVELPQGYLEI